MECWVYYHVKKNNKNNEILKKSSNKGVGRSVMKAIYGPKGFIQIRKIYYKLSQI